MAKPEQGGSTATARAERRSGERVAATVAFTVQGGTELFRGQTVNLSRTGALLWITDERFLPESDATNMVRFSERVAQELGDGMRLEFEGGVARDGEVVRVSRKGRDDRSPMLVACRFGAPLRADDWRALGVPAPGGGQPGAEAAPLRMPEPRPLAPLFEGPPPGLPERRTASRLQKIFAAEVTGDYGTYKAYALNVSPRGALITILDQQFATPDEPDQMVLYTKRLGFQFRNGMVIRFLETGVITEAQVVHVSERTEGDELLIVIGVAFRHELSPGEFNRLEYGHTDAPPVQPCEQAEPAQRNGGGGRVRIVDLMQQAMERKASDLHIKVGAPPRMRVYGRLIDMGSSVLTQEQTRAMASELLTPAHTTRFERDGDLELACTIGDVGRFRVSIFRQRGQTGLAVRCIPTAVPTMESLGISPVAKALADRPRGLVLVTGPTGSGKSHTLAAMVDHINHTRDCHILTMEDPIEFLHEDVCAHITQREIGRDAIDFASALRRALRQDPDVILLGEMRDLETIALALTAAETGHLVFATLHTSSVAQCPERIVDVFPPSQQAQIRLQLSESLQGVMAQILVPTLDGTQVPAQEILVVNDAARALIREAKTPQLYNVIQTGGDDGMITLEAHLAQLVQDGIVDFEIARARANAPDQVMPAAKPRRKR